MEVAPWKHPAWWLFGWRGKKNPCAAPSIRMWLDITYIYIKSSFHSSFLPWDMKAKDEGLKEVPPKLQRMIGKEGEREEEEEREVWDSWLQKGLVPRPGNMPTWGARPQSDCIYGASRLGFLNFGTVDILGQIILCCGIVLCIVRCSAAFLTSTH